MDDSRIHDHIEELVAEEHRLLDRGGQDGGHGLEPDDHARLQQVQVELDRYWDLLRQRRAKRDAGLPISDSGLRDADTVEHYEG